jgi:hypothetical protein
MDVKLANRLSYLRAMTGENVKEIVRTHSFAFSAMVALSGLALRLWVLIAGSLMLLTCEQELKRKAAAKSGMPDHPRLARSGC